MTTKQIKARLQYLRREIQAERISQSEIAELQALAQHIDRGDVLLLEWAGVPENTTMTDPRALAHFANCREYERHLRKGGEIFDNVQIGTILYTMDEYDDAGRLVTYGNKRTGFALQLQTANRYESKKDAKVYKWQAGYWRNDINYLD